MSGTVPALPATLRPNRAKHFALLALCLGFVAMGVSLLGRDNAFVAWGCIAFFGFGAAVFAIGLVPGANGLSLDERGFVVRSLFRSHRTNWKDVAGFHAIRIGVKKFVGFDFVPGVPAAQKLRRANSALVGAEAALPDNYGMSVAALADLLNGLLAAHR
jgi:hypothetical protein